MIRKIFTSICCLVLIIIFAMIGCSDSKDSQKPDSQTPNTGSKPAANISNNKTGITIDDIKKMYTSNKITSITNYKGEYVLVGSVGELGGSTFDFYNLTNGDKDVIPIGPYYAVLEKIQDENHLVFTANGKNTLNDRRDFPFLIDCTRSEQIRNSEADFRESYRDKYLKIGEASEFGGKDDEVLSDLIVTLEGLEILFEPMRGKETGFYAAYTIVPNTKVSYLKESNQLIIEFYKATINGKLKARGLKISGENKFISSIQLKEEDNNIKAIVSLKDTTKYYNAKLKEVGKDMLPFVRFTFRENEQ